MIRDAVLHLTNDQPLLADLLEKPGPQDMVLLCTNLRTLAGARPVWIDDSRSLFCFPFTIVRFVEVHPGSEVAPMLAAASSEDAETSEGPATAPEPELDMEIDENFLRGVRDA